jgi:sortase A
MSLTTTARPQRALEPEPPSGPRPASKKRAPKNVAPGKRPPGRRSKAARVFLVFGVLWLVAGVGMLGWVGWEMWGTNLGVRDEYDRQVAGLQDMWNEEPPADVVPDPVEDPAVPTAEEPVVYEPITLENSRAFAILRIPKLGLVAPIQKGTSNWALANGVGWEDFTAGPGEVGNFVVAGHHSSHGQPFDHLQDLNAGDQYTVETRDATYTYQLLNSPRDKTVDYRETWVMLPDPFEQSTNATRRLGTLLTCKEVFSTPLRSIGFAELIGTEPKA